MIHSPIYFPPFYSSLPLSPSLLPTNRSEIYSYQTDSYYQRLGCKSMATTDDQKGQEEIRFKGISIDIGIDV